MPIIKSAKKALRSSKKKRVYNLKRKDKITKTIKDIKKLVASNKIKEAEAMMPQVQKALDKAVKTNYIKKNTASRKKSRVMSMLNKAKSSK